MILFWSLARGACQYLQPTGVIDGDNGILNIINIINTPFPLYRWLAVGPNFGRLYYI
jgi:hypothetical protein